MVQWLKRVKNARGCLPQRALDRIQTLYYTQPAAEKEKHTVTANVMRYEATGTDETTT
ncbi:hypothetical protein MCOR11_011802, partial [Pyricularia oryzae]